MQNEWLQTLQNMYWIFIFIIYPAIVRNAYADIGSAKVIAFYTLSFLFIISNFVIFIYMKCQKQNLPHIMLSKAEKLLLATSAILAFITFIINGRYNETLFGFNDYASSFLYIETIIIVFTIIKTQKINELIFCTCSSIGLTLVGGIALIQFLNYDFVHMYDSIDPVYSPLTFISTMSNVDCAGFYFAVMLPFSVYLLTKKWLSILGFIGIIMSTFGVIISSSDAAVGGLVIEVILILLVSLSSDIYRKISFYTILFIGIGLALIYGIRYVLHDTRSISYVSMIVTSPPLFLLLIIVSILLLFINSKSISFKWFKILLWAFIALIILTPVYIAVITNSIAPDELYAHPFLSTFSSLFYFDIHWGSSRGYIWMCNIYLFLHGNIINKLFGHGACSFMNLYRDNQKLFHDIYGEMYTDFILTDSHNMYLHFLFEYGLLNLLTVLSFLFCRLKSMKKSDNYYYRLKFCALIGAMIIAITVMSYNTHMAFIPAIL